jgi:hypothetical protein
MMFFKQVNWYMYEVWCRGWTLRHWLWGHKFESLLYIFAPLASHFLHFCQAASRRRIGWAPLQRICMSHNVWCNISWWTWSRVVDFWKNFFREWPRAKSLINCMLMLNKIELLGRWFISQIICQQRAFKIKLQNNHGKWLNSIAKNRNITIHWNYNNSIVNYGNFAINIETILTFRKQ